MQQFSSSAEFAHPSNRNVRFSWTELAWHTLPPSVYFFVMLVFFPYWDMFWIYSDEGFVLMKALLVSRGYSLYNQVWSDQPPLHTELLALIFRLNGPGVFAARLLTLCFTCLLIWAVVQMMRLAWSNGAALAAFLLMILLPTFPLLSVAALIGQPALALACVSLLGLFHWYRRRSWFVLALSGIVMSLSLLTKAFTGLVIPVFAAVLVGVEYFEYGPSRKFIRAIQPAIVWGGLIGVSTIIVSLLLVGPANLVQLIQPHIAATQSDSYPPNEQLYSIWFYLQDAWPFLLLALVGLVSACKQRRVMMLYPAAWLVTAVLILSFYQPIWSHHQTLVTIPAVMLAGGAVADGVNWLAREWKQKTMLNSETALFGMTLLLVLVTLLVRAPDVLHQFQVNREVNNEARPAYEDRVMRRITQYAPRTQWMVTDLPMYAFRAGLLTPPNLAVISWKRLAAGDLSEADILETIREVEPEQILLGRFRFEQVEAFIESDYFPVLEREDQLKLYVRKDLLK